MSLKHKLAQWCEAEISARVAEQIAAEIEQSAPILGPRCPDLNCPVCARSEQARDDAAVARRIGGTS